MSQLPATPPTVISADDEINLADLMRNIWRQRGLVFGVTLATLLLVLVFHVFKASFALPERVDYALSLTFLNDTGQYPNGAVFSPRDIISSRVVEALVGKHSDLNAGNLTKALTVDYSNVLLDKGQEALSATLANAKTPEDIKLATNKALADLRAQTRSVVTVSIDLKEAGINAQQAQPLLSELVELWAEQSIHRGLMNVNISRPASAYELNKSISSVDSFESLTKYIESLKSTLSQLEKLSGSQSLVVDGRSLDDVRRALVTLEGVDVGPLRSFAYSNANALASKNADVRIRLLSRQRLLTLEHERLTKLIASYDSALKQLSQVENSTSTVKQGVASGQSVSSQMDQSFLNSLLELGSKLSNVDVREDLFKKRTKAVEDLLDLEKEIAVLSGVHDNSFNGLDADAVLLQALQDIVPEVNTVQQQITQLVTAYRELTLFSGARLYVADAAPQVRGGGLQIAKKAVLTIALGLILGLMLGVVLALVRAAMINSR